MTEFDRRALSLPASAAPALMVVIDTEEEFDWAGPFGRAGHSIDAIDDLGRAQDLFEQFGIVPVYAVDYPVADHPDRAAALRGWIAGGRAVLAAQLHSWVTLPFDEPLSRRLRTCVHAVDRTQLRTNQTILGHHVYAFLDSNLHGGHGESPHAICLPKRLFASPWGAVGATHQTVLERGTAEHSDRPHRGQASAAKSKSPEQGPSGPRWTRCDNRRNFLYNRSNCLTIGL